MIGFNYELMPVKFKDYNETSAKISRDFIIGGFKVFCEIKATFSVIADGYFDDDIIKHRK